MDNLISNLTVILLLLPPIVGAGLVTILRKKRAIGIITICASALIMIQVFFLVSKIIDEKTVTAFGDAFYIDSLSAVILLSISVVGFVAALYSKNYMGRQYDNGTIDDKHIVRYYQGFNVFLLTMLIVPIANNLGIMWVTVEATTLVSVLLIMLYFKENAIEAAWKYLIIATVGLSFALIGTVFFYYANINANTSDDAMNWTGMVHNAKLFDPNLVKIAFVFILVGFGTKAGLAPMHTWLHDAHSEAPTPVSAVLSAAMLATALVAVLRVHVVAADSTAETGVG